MSYRRLSSVESSFGYPCKCWITMSYRRSGIHANAGLPCRIVVCRLSNRRSGIHANAGLPCRIVVCRLSNAMVVVKCVANLQILLLLGFCASIFRIDSYKVT
jgi:hypothetical protein